MDSGKLKTLRPGSCRNLYHRKENTNSLPRVIGWNASNGQPDGIVLTGNIEQFGQEANRKES